MRWFLTVAAFFLSACGYRLASDGESSYASTVSVPYVKGDTSGKLTDYLVRELEMRGRLNYGDDAALLLEAKIVRNQKEEIGWRYDRKGTNSNRESRLRPTENKQIMAVEVTIKDNTTGEVLFGPQKVEARVDYDYVNFDTITDLAFTPPGGPLTSILAFSLGQLDAVQGAQTAALEPLYQKLAILIANGLDAVNLTR